jgi:tryptophan synthase beta chain
MKLLGATVVPVESGSKTLKDALNEAMRDWVTNVADTFYIIGTVAGPHPYPMMVRDFQSVIGKECLEQMPEMTGRQPDYVLACVGGGSNAMGIFHPYIRARSQARRRRGRGRRPRHRPPFRLADRRPSGRAARQPHLPAAGRERPDHRDALGLGRPRLSRRRPRARLAQGHRRAEYVGITDDEALAAFHNLCRLEGIIPALESAHALAYAAKLAPTLPKDKILLVNLSGRGDKDMHTVASVPGSSSEPVAGR